ncbi:MAG: hydroxymethylbilane synthase [Bacteroidetes bacterium]|nr:hydroxymethylbilane synthase [Bacteroidota bacterium]HET6245650.1 hydroxymethylbilane synthase [Bacteroidia bacterium]
MKRKLIIGSRGSGLALWQANYVQAMLKDIGVKSEIKIIKTQGDKIQHLSFDKLEGKGFFTKEIEDALISGETDLAVHSHKDLPTTSPIGLIVAAVSIRGNPSELIIINKNAVDYSLKYSIKKGAVIGTSSARRKCQLLAHRDDLQIKDIRGNVPTRIDKLRSGEFDAILIAAAGVERLELDLNEFTVERPSPREFIPAPAQGVLAIQVREQDKELIEKLSEINVPFVQECIAVERKILNLFDGGCQLPLGSYCFKEDGIYKVFSAKADNWSTPPKRIYAQASSTEGLAELIVEKIRNFKPCQVFITRDLDEDNYLLKSLTSNRYQVTGISLIDVKPIRFSSIPDTDWIFFSSSHAVKEFFNQNPLVKPGIKYAVIGKGTETTLNTKGIKADFVGLSSDTSLVGKEFAKIANEKTVLFPQAKDSLRSVQKQLSFQTKIYDLFVYKSTPKNNISIPQSDVVVFTSPSNVEAYFKFSDLSNVQRVICIGSATAEKLKTHGFNESVIPEYPDEAGLLQAIFGLSFE